MAAATFRIACIGLGHRLAQIIVLLQRAAPQMAFVAYADPAPAGLPRLQRHGIDPRAHLDPAAMLRSVRPDAVMIGSPNHLHLHHLELALDSDARIFCEKPLVRTEQESFVIAERLAGEATDRVIVGLVLRSLPVIERTLSLVREGGLGTLISFEANEHLHPEHGGFLRRDWRRKRRYAGSYLLDKCCHDIDLLNALVGSRPCRVASFGANRIFTPKHAALGEGGDYRQWPTGWSGSERIFDSDADTYDVQTLMLEYESGVIGSFHSNSHVNPPRRSWLVAGTEASLEVDLRRGRLERFPARDVDPAERQTFGDGDTRNHSGADPAMARDLAAAWLEGRTFPVSARDALTAGLVVMAADRAAATGQVVDLGEVWRRLDASR